MIDVNTSVLDMRKVIIVCDLVRYLFYVKGNAQSFLLTFLCNLGQDALRSSVLQRSLWSDCIRFKLQHETNTVLGLLLCMVPLIS